MSGSELPVVAVLVCVPLMSMKGARLIPERLAVLLHRSAVVVPTDHPPCDRCGKDRTWRAPGRCATSSAAPVTTAVAAWQGKAELLMGIEGVSSRPVHRIVLISD